MPAEMAFAPFSNATKWHNGLRPRRNCSSGN